MSTTDPEVAVQDGEWQSEDVDVAAAQLDVDLPAEEASPPREVADDLGADASAVDDAAEEEEVQALLGDELPVDTVDLADAAFAASLAGPEWSAWAHAGEAEQAEQAVEAAEGSNLNSPTQLAEAEEAQLQQEGADEEGEDDLEVDTAGVPELQEEGPSANASGTPGTETHRGLEQLPLCDLVKREVQQQLSGALREVHLRLAVLQARGSFGDKVVAGQQSEQSNVGQAQRQISSFEEEDDDEDCEHVVEESIWEAVVLVGVPGVGIAGSVLMLAGLLVNFLLQVLFILALFLDTLRWWAMLAKQRSGQLPAAPPLPTPYVSNNSMILDGNSSMLDGNSSEVPLRNTVKAYLDNSRIASFIGIVFCGCVLLLWFLNIAQEFIEVASFSSALLQLPRAARTELVWCGYGSVLTSITRWRRTVMLFIMLIRFLVAFSLLLLGALWFTHTTSMLDLVLNAAVVAFILDLDEQVFLKFVPFRVRLILQDLLPLRTARSPVTWCTPRMVLAGSSVLTLTILMATVAWGSVLPAIMDAPARPPEL